MKKWIGVLCGLTVFVVAGCGPKKSLVMVYKTKAAMTKFVESGWGVGANADAAAKTSGGGAEASDEGDISRDIEVYSMTEAGLALQATVKGTKYWKDESLN